MPLAVSIDNMVAAVRREIGFRQRVYPRWVSQGKMKAETSAVEIERMEAVLEALEELRLLRLLVSRVQEDGAGYAGELMALEDFRKHRAPLTHGTQSKPAAAP